MNKHYRAAIKRALWIGIPFGLWAILVISSVDSTSGSVISFAVGLPAIILSFLLGLYWLFFMILVQATIGQYITIPESIGYIGLIACPAINSAIKAYSRSKQTET
ncbi:hypothetical protein [Shewanella ulleungensis]|uniref:Uncharacterized protein n=1 Tax=Shewanella ulleungensis TaxID=2282699 RepID=A0ABQ2QZT7_9GAMM|nr:hypothetical protein [Shewanella ulleungensis]MCL1152353.1 hypothetical protein [Shewanella ulleungensis]GGQ01532.1 hypothetical protein GCM10009410_38880 [Shewanella ulleungensis]